MLRRVRKSDIQTETIVKPDGLLLCLDAWKQWMQKDDRDLSASKMMLRSESDEERVAYESDLNDEQRKADNRIGHATDAMIDSMPRIHVWAIYRKCSITTQWYFPRAAFLDVLEEAEKNLTAKLKNNIATGTLFD
jgi:hypothetical protein